MRALDLGEVLWNPSAAAIGARNAIVSDSAPKRLAAFAGALSIKYMLSGWAVWEVGGRRLRVEGDAFLILNHGTVYSLVRPADEPTESFCPFFARGFVEAAARAATDSAEALLDDPEGARRTSFQVREQLHTGGGTIVARLRALAQTIHEGVATPLMVDEQFAALARALVVARDRISAERASVPAARAATRAELHARLQRARERMHDEIGARLTLATLARAACLSPPHFHQAFRAVYGESAHRYQTRLRLDRARRLLRATERSVTEICVEVGFESLGSFSSLFKRELGVSPIGYRNGADGIRRSEKRALDRAR